MELSQRFTAREVVEKTGATPRQVRYWDQSGLLSPSVQQTGGKPGVPRIYSDMDVRRIRWIVDLLHSGMSLQKVRQRVWKEPVG